MRDAKLALAKRILWRWLRFALALEAALVAVMVYLGLKSGVPAYQSAVAVENFVLYSMLALVASGVIAAAETLAKPEL